MAADYLVNKLLGRQQACLSRLVALCVQLVILETSPEAVAMQCKGGSNLCVTNTHQN